MDRPLDVVAARLVAEAKLFERAVHDHGPWTMHWGPHEVEAERTVSDHGIVFHAWFPDSCYLECPDQTVELRCKGQVLTVRAIEYPGDGSFGVEWYLVPKVEAPA